MTVVRDVDLEVHEGEVVALLGPNGAGKTTTILTLAGELAPLGGAVRCLGLDNDASLHQRARAGLALVTDARAVFTRMTVAENIRVFRTTAEAVVELFPELEAHLDRRVALLSGGQQQMLALGLALSRSPAVVLADELSMGLAPMIVDRLFAALRTAADRGAGVLLVEQHVHKAMTIADRVYVMDRGRISITGTADELRQRVDEIQSSYLANNVSLTRRAGHGGEEAAEEALPRLVVGYRLTGAALHQETELQGLEEVHDRIEVGIRAGRAFRDGALYERLDDGRTPPLAVLGDGRRRCSALCVAAMNASSCMASTSSSEPSARLASTKRLGDGLPFEAVGRWSSSRPGAGSLPSGARPSTAKRPYTAPLDRPAAFTMSMIFVPK